MAFLPLGWGLNFFFVVSYGESQIRENYGHGGNILKGVEATPNPPNLEWRGIGDNVSQ